MFPARTRIIGLLSIVVFFVVVTVFVLHGRNQRLSATVTSSAQCGGIVETTIPTSGSGPQYPVAGPDGNVWFTELSGNKIGKINPQGTISEYLVPSTGQNTGGPPTADPMDLMVGPDGNLWFTEYNVDNKKIGRVSPAGFFMEYQASDLARHPTTGPDGNIWYTVGTKIGRITMAGVLGEFTSGIPSGSVSALVAGPDSNVWFATTGPTHYVGKMTPSGVATTFDVPTPGSGNGQPDTVQIVVGPDANLWFNEYIGNKIGRITTSGTLTEFNVPTASALPTNLILGPDGNLWFGETNKLAKIAMDGTITEYSVDVGPSTIVSGPDGNIWFTASNKIYKYKTDGTQLAQYNVPVSQIAPTMSTFGADGNFYYLKVGSGNKVGKLNISSCCGNSVLDTAEECDDGNTNAGDGCSTSCTIEAGWNCQNTSQVGSYSAPRLSCVAGTPTTVPYHSPESIRDALIAHGVSANLYEFGCGWIRQNPNFPGGNDFCTGLGYESGTNISCQYSNCSIAGMIASPAVAGHIYWNGSAFAYMDCTTFYYSNNSTYHYYLASVDCMTTPTPQCTFTPGTLPTVQASVCKTQCNDGVDNDANGMTDYPSDPGCTSATDITEATPVTPVVSSASSANSSQVSTLSSANSSSRSSLSSLSSASSSRIAQCGNSWLDPNETCDDGNAITADGCSSCQIDRYWTCTTAPGERSYCTGICGDGVKKGAEQCDDGNLANNDGCTSECVIEQYYACTTPGQPCTGICGDGTKKGTEQCDDGNLINGDGCSSTCRTEYCGDGTIQTGLGEKCDDGNRDNSDACTNVCQNAVCGDGTLEPGLGEQCDDGNQSNNDACTNACRNAVCGDGFLQLLEQCDDGNTRNGDGCSSNCTIEIHATTSAAALAPRTDAASSVATAMAPSSAQTLIVTQCIPGTQCASGGTCLPNGVCGAASSSSVATVALQPEASSLPSYNPPAEPMQVLVQHAAPTEPSQPTVTADQPTIVQNNSPTQNMQASSSALHTPPPQTSSARTVALQNAAPTLTITTPPQLPTSPSEHPTLQPVCGNGIQEVGEACDRGQANEDTPGAICRSNCQLARCGDGITDVPFEQCDAGAQNGNGPTATCSLSCALVTRPQTLAANIVNTPIVVQQPTQLQLPQQPQQFALQPVQAQQQYQYPVMLNPLTAQLQYPTHAPVGATGPGSLAVMAAGAAGGIGLVRRRKK